MTAHFNLNGDNPTCAQGSKPAAAGSHCIVTSGAETRPKNHCCNFLLSNTKSVSSCWEHGELQSTLTKINLTLKITSLQNMHIPLYNWMLPEQSLPCLGQCLSATDARAINKSPCKTIPATTPPTQRHYLNAGLCIPLKTKPNAGPSAGSTLDIL